jgi:hypothetical protein
MCHKLHVHEGCYEIRPQSLPLMLIKRGGFLNSCIGVYGGLEFEKTTIGVVGSEWENLRISLSSDGRGIESIFPFHLESRVDLTRVQRYGEGGTRWSCGVRGR